MGPDRKAPSSRSPYDPSRWNPIMTSLNTKRRLATGHEDTLVADAGTGLAATQTRRMRHRPRAGSHAGYFRARSIMAASLLAALFLSTWTATARAATASTFDSSAALTFTINSIGNQSNPGSTGGLQVSHSFEQGDPQVVATGDGTVTANNTPIGPAPLPGSSFSHTFAVSGSVSPIGDLSSSHLGLYGLSFLNTSGDTFHVEVTLSYQLNASVSGEYADSDVYLDYMTEDFSPLGSDLALASVFAQATVRNAGDSGALAFVIGPEGSGGLLADVRINGNLQAVPVPAAFWSLASSAAGLAVFGRRKG